MIEDAEERGEERFTQPFDVCVIGAGPAGITLARRLGAAGFHVGLFEAGGFELTADSQDVYRGSNTGVPAYYPLDGCRLRYFGGTSNHWGGWTRPLDAWDFTPNPHNALSGWPIGKADLDPYAEEAATILDLTPDRPPPDLLGGTKADLLPRLFRFSRPATRFGEKYRGELEASKTVDVFLNANLVDMRLDADGRNIAEAVFRSYRRPEPFSVRARLFALCLGGLENPRALLNANGERPAGIGNEHDLVGRYFLEHPHAPVGRIVTRDPLTWMVVYSPTPALMREKGVLNFGLRIGNFDQWNAPDFTGALQAEPPCTTDFDALLQAAIDGSAPPCPAHVGDVFVACEQELSADNRVRLIDERDRFGLRRIALHWSVSALDLKTLATAAAEVASRFAERDRGRMQIIEWLRKGESPTPDRIWGGNHHMGTTRMSGDARHGVVDADCRIHSVGNLYCGGSSVFATSGHANPTYTIVELALRLGDHLQARLR